jgi:hypothetical protein
MTKNETCTIGRGLMMNSLTLAMGENSILKIDGDRRGTLISCEKGTVSLTRQNDSEDHMLSNGSFLINKRGRVIAWALSEASLEIVLQETNRYGVIQRLRKLIAFST